MCIIFVIFEGNFNCSAFSCAVYEQNIYTLEASKINVRTYQVSILTMKNKAKPRRLTLDSSVDSKNSNIQSQSILIFRNPLFFDLNSSVKKKPKGPKAKFDMPSKLQIFFN